MIMQLNTKEEITIAAFGHEHIVVDCESIGEFRQIHDKMLADGAMDTVTIEDSGQTIATIHGATIAGTQTVAVVGDPEKVTGHFYLQGGTYDLDDGEYAQAGRILLGEE